MSVLQDIGKEVSDIAKNISTLSEHSGTFSSGAKTKTAEIVMEEKYRNVARKVDFRCMIIYVTLMILFHIVIATVVVLGV